MRHLSDSELMDLVRQKNADALETIYDRYSGFVYSIAVRMLGDEQTACDAVQTVFIRLWTSGDRYNPVDGRFAGWLATVTRRICLDRLRVLRRERAVFVQEPFGVAGCPSLKTTEQESESVWTRQRIREALGGLSDAQRRLIELMYWRGYTLAEIAAMDGEPVGTMKNRLHQALARLRRHLEHREGNDLA